MSDTPTGTPEDQPEAKANSACSATSSSPDAQQNAASSAVYDKAVDYLCMQTGDAAEAKRALEATASPELTDAVRWAEAAAVWLACVNEVDIEQKAMGAAMEQSLVEAEAEKEKEKPIHEQSDEQLKLRYERSILLMTFSQEANTVLPSLWEHHRKFLLDLLELELKAYRWYPRAGTKLYLQRLGQDCASLLCCTATPTSSPVQTRKPTWQSSNKHKQVSDNADPAAILSEQLSKLQSVLFAMPDTSNAVPSAFTDAEEAQQDEGIDEIVERPKKRLCEAECVDLA